MRKKGFLYLVVIISISSNIYAETYTSNLKNSFETEVYKVIDGDTIEIRRHARVRYIGINAPEIGQPFYEEAKNRNRKLVEGKKVKLIVCKSEPNDKYGRMLAWVYVGNTLVNAMMVKEGYAKTFIISSCGAERKEEFEGYERNAIKNKMGLWSDSKKVLKDKIISAAEADRYIGEIKSVRGKVINIFETDNAAFLNFGYDYKKDFTIVIFQKHKVKFQKNGITSFNLYKDKEVMVTGRIQQYNGPEIIADDPSQIDIIGRR